MSDIGQITKQEIWKRALFKPLAAARDFAGFSHDRLVGYRMVNSPLVLIKNDCTTLRYADCEKTKVGDMSVQIVNFDIQRGPIRLLIFVLASIFIAASLLLFTPPTLAETLEQQLKKIEEVLPGNSYTKFSPALAAQSWEMAATVAYIQKPSSCESVKLVDTKVTAVKEKVVFTSKRKLKQGRWSEIWTFNKCGKRVRVQADFKADGRGAADGEFALAK